MKLIEMPIEEACRAKWDAGQKVYGKVFVGHPLEQLDAEFVDALNYIEEGTRWGFDFGDMKERITEMREYNRKMYQKSI